MIELNEEYLDLIEIESEEIEDKNGNKYIPERFRKCFLPQNDLAHTLTLITLKFILVKMKYPDRNPNIFGPQEIYIINHEWYDKWKNYSKYNTLKRIIKAYDIYEKRPIKFIPNEKNFPGKINNENLLIRNKINETDRNILISKNNNILDTKLNYINKNKNKNKKDFKLLSKERFDLLNDYFKCDCIIKSQKIIKDNFKNYDFFSIHLNIIFLPTLITFKNVDENSIDNFKNSQKIIYDVYFKQNDTKSDIINELLNIIKEKPQILYNMGVELKSEDNNEDELNNHIKNFKFYIPNEKNTKSANEIVDFIFSDITIEKIKKDEKISKNDIDIIKINNEFSLNNLFHIDFINSKNNIDEVQNGIFFIEYLMFDDLQAQSVSSIFEL